MEFENILDAYVSSIGEVKRYQQLNADTALTITSWINNTGEFNELGARQHEIVGSALALYELEARRLLREAIQRREDLKEQLKGNQS